DAVVAIVFPCKLTLASLQPGGAELQRIAKRDGFAAFEFGGNRWLQDSVEVFGQFGAEFCRAAVDVGDDKRLVLVRGDGETIDVAVYPPTEIRPALRPQAYPAQFVIEEVDDLRAFAVAEAALVEDDFAVPQVQHVPAKRQPDTCHQDDGQG